MNKTILVGNVGGIPRVFRNAEFVTAGFSMATNERWKDKATGETRERVEWHNVVTFNGLAEVVERYLEKGRLVTVEGKLRTRKYEKNGTTHYMTEVIADSVVFLGPRPSAGTSAPTAASQAAANEAYDDDIPF